MKFYSFLCKKLVQFPGTILAFIIFFEPLFGVIELGAEKCLPASGLCYKTIADLYLSSYEIVKKEEMKAPEDSPETGNKKNKKNPLNLQPSSLSKREELELTFNLFSAQEAQNRDSDSLLTIAKDLEIFVGQGKNPKKNICATIDNTVTTFGAVKLAHMLINPTDDKAILHQRQQFVKALATDDKLLSDVEQMLITIKKAEGNFFSFFKIEDEANKEFLDNKLFFTKKIFQPYNTSPYALEIITRLRNLKTAWDSVSLIAIPLLAHYGLMQAKRKEVRRKVEYTADESLAQMEEDIKLGVMTSDTAKANARIEIERNKQKQLKDADEAAALKNSLKLAWGFMGQIYPPQIVQDYRVEVDEAVADWANGYRQNPFNHNQDPPADLLKLTRIGAQGGFMVQRGLIFAYLLWALWRAKNALQSAAEQKNMINFLHSRVNAVAVMVNSCSQLGNLAQQNKTVAQGLQGLSHVQRLLSQGTQDKEFSNLIALLQKDTFKSDASFFALSGRALAAYQLLQIHKDKMGSIVELLGELDACMSIAKLYKKMNDQEITRYSFVEYVTKEQPHLQLTEFWHPLIAAEKVVANDMAFGKSERSVDAIITGSNTGGKSTILKAMLLNVLCAQTLTIAPAQSCVLDPFSYVGSYLHVLEDTSEESSLFKAEVLRAKALLENASSLAAGKYAFIVIDELFTGTASEKGALAAYKVAQKLASLSQVIFALATHFPLLTTLEQDTNGICKNYKVDVIKQEDGTIVRPFKIEPGISQTSIAQEILQEELGGIDFDI